MVSNPFRCRLDSLRAQLDLTENSTFGKEELELLLSSVEGVEMWEMAPVVSFVTSSWTSKLKIDEKSMKNHGLRAFSVENRLNIDGFS